MSVNSPATEVSRLINPSFSMNHPQAKLNDCFIAICERHPSEDAHLIARRVLMGSAMAISAIAKIPFIPISLKLGPIIAPFSIVGNGTGFFILEYWAAAATINDLLGQKNRAEIELVAGEKAGKGRVCRNVVVISVASLIALSSQLPTALAGVDYNPEQFKLVAGIVLLVAGALIPLRSLQLSLEQIQHLAQRSVDSEITEIKEKMIALIQANQGIFIDKKYEEKISFCGKCNETRCLDSSSVEKTNQYTLTLLQKNDSQMSQVKKITRNGFNYVGIGVGTILAGLFEFSLGQYTYDLSKEEVWNNDIAGGVFTTLAVGSTAYLFGKSIIMTTQRIFNVFGNLVTGGEVRNLGWQLRPKLSFALTAIGLLIDVCALGPTYVIWGDFYDTNEVEHQLFQKTMCASLFLLLFTSSLDIIDDVVKSFIAKGSAEEKEILKINNEFQKLAEILEKSSSRQFIEYLTDMDEPTRKILMERMSVSAQQLESFSSNV